MWPFRRKPKKLRFPNGIPRVETVLVPPWRTNTYVVRAEAAMLPDVPEEPSQLWELPPDPFIPEDWGFIGPKLLPREDYVPLTAELVDGSVYTMGFVHKDRYRELCRIGVERLRWSDIVEPHRVSPK